MMPDWKNIGTKAIDIVAGVGGAVAGAYGGPAAASGVQQAGGAIKSLVEDGGDAPKQTRTERFDRADLGTRRTPAPVVRPPAVNMDQQTKLRSYFASLGWSGSDLERIMNGPKGGERS